MHRPTLAFAGFVLTAASCALYAQSSAPITAVTLYPGSATIVRTARVDGATSRVVVAELPVSFSLQTLRVDADAGIRVGQIVTQDAARTESGNVAEASLETRIQALKDQSATLDVQAGAADIVKAYLERTGGEPAGNDRSNVQVDAKSLAAMVGAINQAALDALGKKQQVAVQKREIDKKVEALERDLKKVRSESRDSRTVTIELATDRPGNVRISYQLNNAGWRPAYRAELNSAASSVMLERLAQVSQKTGEDWKGVRLALSTVQPRLSPSAVTPQPWLLSYVPPRPAEEAARYAYPAAAPAPAPPAAMAFAPANAEPAYRPPTFQSEGVFATEFVVPTPVTLPSDGREVSLALAKVSLNTKQRIQVTPRISTTPIVIAEAEKPAGVWPDGNLQLYRDGSYVGASAWNPQGTEKWNLSFGRDDLVQVRLNAVKGDSGTAGFFEKRNQRRIADQITVRNNHTFAMEVLTIESSPVSTSDEVKVQTVFNPKPTFENWEQRRGVVAWQRTVAPQETATIDLSYSIEYPKEGAISGLR